jgi:ABC-type uncharacterized transport system ATPase component
MMGTAANMQIEENLALAARRQWEEKWDCRKNYTAFAKFLASL